MNRVTKICGLMGLILCAAQANADFQKGLTAYDAGKYEEAFSEWLESAEAGDLAAQRNVGQLYRWGRGVEKSSEKAFYWYKKAADKGFSEAEYSLALMYLSGEGTAKNEKEAIRLLRGAAKKGSYNAERKLIEIEDIVNRVDAAASETKEKKKMTVVVPLEPDASPAGAGKSSVPAEPVKPVSSVNNVALQTTNTLKIALSKVVAPQASAPEEKTVTTPAPSAVKVPPAMNRNQEKAKEETKTVEVKVEQKQEEPKKVETVKPVVSAPVKVETAPVIAENKQKVKETKPEVKTEAKKEAVVVASAPKTDVKSDLKKDAVNAETVKPAVEAKKDTVKEVVKAENKTSALRENGQSKKVKMLNAHLASYKSAKRANEGLEELKKKFKALKEMKSSLRYVYLDKKGEYIRLYVTGEEQAVKDLCSEMNAAKFYCQVSKY